MTGALFINGVLGMVGWLGIAALAVLISGLVYWLWNVCVDVSAASIERPRRRHLHIRGVPPQLVAELRAMNHLTDDDLDLELANLRRRTGARTGFGVESTTLPVYAAKEIAGIPLSRIRNFMQLTGLDLRTAADVRRWQEVHDQVVRRVQKVQHLINVRRALLKCAEPDPFVPTYLRPVVQPEVDPSRGASNV